MTPNAAGLMTVPVEVGPTPAVPSVVLCGSFRREIASLRCAFEELVGAECELLSPSSVDFVDYLGGFARTAQELNEPPFDIEHRHVTALRRADFVWLHAPGGYVGASAAFEIGIAGVFEVPIFAREAPTDVMLGGLVQVVSSPTEAIELVRSVLRTPAGPLRDLQRYYERVAAERGFASESPQDTMLLLTEEMGELARAIRKSVGLARADDGLLDPAAELADVQLYVLHLANVIGIDLAEAVANKEQVNHGRYSRRAA